MKSNLELALIACSYRPVTSENRTVYMKLYGFNWILFDMSIKEVISYFAGKEDFTCWNRKSFEELFDENTQTVLQYAQDIQYYERYDGPHGHGGSPNSMDNYMLIDDYFKQFQFL